MLCLCLEDRILKLVRAESGGRLQLLVDFPQSFGCSVVALGRNRVFRPCRPLLQTLLVRERAPQPGGINAAHRVIHAIVVDVAVAARVICRVRGGEAAHLRIVVTITRSGPARYPGRPIRLAISLALDGIFRRCIGLCIPTLARMRMVENNSHRFRMLFALLFVLSLMPSCRAADAPTEKDTPLCVKNVVIKGAKVRLPIPDGYEEMQREDDPETYDWMKEVNSDDGTLPLAYLIHSDDKARLKNGEDVNLRYGFAIADESSWDAVVISDTIKKGDRAYFTQYIKDINDGANELSQKAGEDLYDWKYIHSGLKTISWLSVSQNKINVRKFKGARTGSFIIVDHKTIIVCLYFKVYTDNDIYQLTNTTVSYLKKIDRAHF